MLTMQDIMARPSLYAAAKLYRLLYVDEKEITLKAEYLLLREIMAAFPEEEWEHRVYDRTPDIDGLFHWDLTNQGFAFWEHLHYMSGIITRDRATDGLRYIRV